MRATVSRVVLATVVVCFTFVGPGTASDRSAAPQAASSQITVTMPAAPNAKVSNAQYSTQEVWGVSNGLQTPPSGISPLQRLANLNPPNFRIHAGTDAGLASVDLPFNAPYTSSDGQSPVPWDFRHLNSLVAETVGRTSGSMMLNVRYAPDNMWTGSGPLGGNGNAQGVLLDQTYSAFATYMADLVKYYNTSNPPPGAIPTRPAGIGPIRYWEIWNEPDYSGENPRLPPSLPPPGGVTLTGVSVPGGTLVPGTTYSYRITPLTSTNQEGLASTAVNLTLGAGLNSIKIAWNASTNLGRVAAAYWVYGRSGAVGQLVVVGKDNPAGLSWTDKGTITAGGPPPNADYSLGGPTFTPLEYKALWDKAVPAMKAVDPTIKVVGPVCTNPISIGSLSVITTAVTTGPSDPSYLDSRDFVQVLMTSINRPDVISYHGYGGFQGATDSDSLLMSAIRQIPIDVTNNILPYSGTTPTWHTEANVNAAGDSTNRPARAFGAAWEASLFANLAPTGVGTIHEYLYADSPTFGLITESGSPVAGAVEGNPYLPYWVEYWIDQLFAPGAKILSVGNVPSGLDVLAVANPPDFTKVTVLVVNRQVPATNTPISVQLAGVTSTGTRVRVIDSTTNVVSGPGLVTSGSAQTATAQLNGYSLALIEFDTGTGLPLPTVTSLVPNTGPVIGGTSVVITGTNFTGATAVKFGTAAAATYSVTSATQITATSPPGSGTVDVTVTTPNGTSAINAAAKFSCTLPPVAYTAQSPNRILDTRSSGQTLSGGGSLNLTVVGGTTGVPATATGVVLNVTVTNTTAPSFLKVGPAGGAAATVSNLNWVAGETRANLVNVPVGSGGQVSIYNGVGSADVVVDEQGYFAAPVGTAGGYNALPPQRLLDTRLSRQTVGTGSTIDLQVLGVGGVPATGVSAVVLNATATKTATQGYFTLFPSGTARPTASNVNWAAGWTLPNLVIVKVGSNGKVSIYNGQGAADAVIDVSGYFTDSTASGKLFIPLTPARVIDTRVSGGTIGPNGTLSNFQITGNNGVPTGATAVFLNTTVTNTTASSALTVFPGPTQPTASDLNWTAGQTIPNLTLATLSSSGASSYYNFVGSTDVVLDLSGFFA